MNRFGFVALAIASVALVIAPFLLAVVRHGLDSSEAAAWGQAVFTVVAILVTGQMALLPLREDRAERLRTKKAFFDALGDAYILGQNHACKLNDAVVARDLTALRLAQHVLRGDPTLTLKRMLELPVTAWPDALLFDLASRYDHALEFYMNISWEVELHAERDWKMLEDWYRNFNEIADQFDRSLCQHSQRLSNPPKSLWRKSSRSFSKKAQPHV